MLYGAQRRVKGDVNYLTEPFSWRSPIGRENRRRLLTFNIINHDFRMPAMRTMYDQ